MVLLFYNLQYLFLIKNKGSKSVVCARMGGANTTSFLAAHFARRNTKNCGGVKNEGGANLAQNDEIVNWRWVQDSNLHAPCGAPVFKTGALPFGTTHHLKILLFNFYHKFKRKSI